MCQGAFSSLSILLSLRVMATEVSRISRRFRCRRACSHHGVNGIALKTPRIQRTAIVCSC